MSQEKEVMVSEEQQEVTEAKFDGAVADGSSLGSVEDLGGPTPTNNKPDDESNKLKTPSQTQASAPKTKPSDASPKKHESVEAENAEGDELIEIDLSADVAALTEGEDLSEEFKAKAATIFEAAVVSRLNEELDRVHGEYASALSEQVESVKASLAEQVDEYLTYAVQEWMGKNEIAIETGLKSEIAESVVAGLKKVFVENHIEVPEEKTDIISEMVTELDSMEAKLNEQIDKNVALTREVGAFVKNGIVSEISEGLAATEREKLAGLAEGVEFEDEESFRSKIETLKESYFSSKPQAAAETIAEDVQPVVDSDMTESMSRYVDALRRWTK
jgi:hypothetical protein|tara:strand:+ start:10824 stop:11816 length:993 start_codon:yes stop_codon:yes gene_type:complete